MINKYMNEIQSAESNAMLDDIIERAAQEPEYILSSQEYELVCDTAVNKAKNWFV
ncbi:MAG: hypothetical protein AB7D36_05530 [Oscillospiraceae bacterium]